MRLATLLAGGLAVARAQEVVKIMPLGDSITGSPGCWRALLWRDLQDAGVTNTDFVGTLPGQGCGFEYDGENEGHGGFLATNIAAEGLLTGWLEATGPDVVMVHLGTNDVWSNIAAEEIVAALESLVGDMRANNPAMKILIAQIIPVNPPTCPECADRTVALNEAVAEWAPGVSTEGSPVTVVDCWTGFDTDTMTGDGVHPNEAGNEKLAECWFEPLVEVIQSFG
ncbi:hypothetical protein VUR80DRAFT_7615 [Thermomyces stellatus]